MGKGQQDVGVLIGNLEQSVIWGAHSLSVAKHNMRWRVLPLLQVGGRQGKLAAYRKALAFVNVISGSLITVLFMQIGRLL